MKVATLYSNRMMNTALIVIYLLIAIYCSYSHGSVLCEEKGSCESCRKEELNAEYCRTTGNKVRFICNDGENEFDDYRSCAVNTEEAQGHVVIFQVFMGIIGGLAYWGVQRRKMQSMSLFDHRKLSRRP